MSTEKTEFNLPIAGLAAAFPMAGKNDVRYYLNGVLVEVTPKSVMFVGTDGHTLAFAKHDCDDNTETAEFIIARDDVSAILKNIRPENALRVFLSAQGTGLTIQFGTHTLETSRIDGKYPKWRDAASITAGQRGQNLALNAKFLGLVQKSIAAANKLGGLKSSFVAIETNGRDRPAI